MRPITAPPEIDAIAEEFTWAVNRRQSNIFRRQAAATRARNCWWPGQTEDGKRWWKLQGEDEVFPWPGAADSRVHLVDTYCREDVAMLMNVWRRNKIRVSPVESSDDAFSNRMTNLLRWMKYTQMREAPREVRLLSNLQIERGSAVVGVFWDRREQLGYDPIDLESIKGISMQAQQAMAQDAPDIHPGVPNSSLVELPAILADPSREDEAEAIAMELYPDASRASMRQCLKELRANGVSRLARAYTVCNRPRITTFATNEDIFIPPEANGLQESSGIFWREMLTDTALRERQHSFDWDPAWIEEVIKNQRGRMTSSLAGIATARAGQQLTSQRSMLDTARLYEVIHAYRRQSDENGVPGIFYTVFHMGMVAKSSGRKRGFTYASHQLLNYDHGLYPFVLFENETRSRIVDDARGYGEVMSTWQDGVKAEVDSRRDRASLATLPPSYHPPGAAPDRWGPGVQISTGNPTAYGFFKAPVHDSGSRESESTLRAIADRWAGRVLVDQSNAVQAGNMIQDRADQWMESHAEVDSMLLKLMQQFMDDQFFFRVVGSEKGRAIHTTREEIQGEFDVSLSYNTDDMVPAVVKEKLGLMQQALQLDRNGTVDMTEAVQVAFEKIDPNLGERLLRPAAAAYEAEIKDEADVFAQINAGISVDVKPGQNYQARLQWLDQMLKTNQEAREKYEKNEYFAEVLDKRIAQLKFQIEQFTVNAQIGRTGA